MQIPLRFPLYAVFLSLFLVHTVFASIGTGTLSSTVEINGTTVNGPSLSSSDAYGRSVVALGDLDRDGVEDIAVGAYQDDAGGPNRGAVHIHFMNANGSIKNMVEINDNTTSGPTLSDDDWYGSSLANIGDLDGDGVIDLAVGAVQDDAGGTNRGAVHLHFMNTNGSIKSTVEINDTTSNGPNLSNSDSYALDLASVGDLDNDGVVDLAVGAPGDNTGGLDRGTVYIHFMNTNGSIKSTVEISDDTVNGPSLINSDTFGNGLLALGDLNGDGVEDLGVGAPYNAGSSSDDEGAFMILFLNTDGSLDATVEINESTPNGPSLSDDDGYGVGATNLGDLNGDGVVDLAVGAPGDNGSGTDRGTVYIHFMNTDGSIDSTVEINGTTLNGPSLSDSDFYGRRLANIGDLNNDGLVDLLVGANGDNGTGADQGAVHIHFLQKTTWTISGKVYSDTGNTPLSDGRTVRLLLDGVSVGSDVLDNGDGSYSISGVDLTQGSVLTAYLDEASEDGVTITLDNAAHISGLDIYQNHLITRTETGTALTNAYLDTAHNGDPDITGIYSDGGGNTLDLNASLFIPSGHSYAPGGTVNVSGNWTKNGTFTASTHNVIFDGSGSASVSGSSTFFNLSSATAGKMVLFEAGSTQTVTGTLTFTGAAANFITLRSSVEGTYWNLIVNGSHGVSYVNVKDSNASGGMTITQSNSVDAGHNVNWIFNSAPTVSSITPLERTDGTGNVSIAFTVDDVDDNDSIQAKLEYSLDNGSTWNDPTLSSTVTASFGSPSVNNAANYQLGQTGGFILSSSGANGVTVLWQAGVDLPSTIDLETVRIRVTPYDGLLEGSSSVSNAFTLDLKDPVNLGDFHHVDASINSLYLAWNAVTDSHFDHYEIWYGENQSSVESRLLTGGAIEWDNEDDSSLAVVSQGSTVLTGFSPSGKYFKLFAIDDFGNDVSTDGFFVSLSQSSSEVTVNLASPGSSSSSSSGSSASSSSSSIVEEPVSFEDNPETIELTLEDDISEEGVQSEEGVAVELQEKESFWDEFGYKVPNHWSSGYVRFLQEEDHVAKMAQAAPTFVDTLESLFTHPNDGVERGQVLEFLLVLAGYHIDTIRIDLEKLPFYDVSTNTERAEEIFFTYKRGLVEGYPNGLFQPFKVINRAESLKMCARFFGLQVESDLSGEDLLSAYGFSESPFSDLDLNAWYAPFVVHAYSNGVIEGYPGGFFKPGQEVTFAELLKIATLMRYIDQAPQLASELSE